MTTKHEADVIEDSVEPLLEELLAEVVTGIRSESKGNTGESLTAALAEAAMASFSRTVSQGSAVERALLVDALAPALADALAPALAKTLAPEIVTALGHLAAGPESTVESGHEKPGHEKPGHEKPGHEESHAAEGGSGKGKKGRSE